MKRLLLVAWVVLLAPPRAFAAETCVKDGVLLFPAPGSVVPTNAQLIIEGTGTAQVLVQGLLGNEALALVSEGQEPIAVKAEKGFVSQMSRVAVRLRPLKALLPNVEYSLALPKELAGVRLLNDRLGDGSLQTAWVWANEAASFGDAAGLLAALEEEFALEREDLTSRHKAALTERQHVDRAVP